MSHMCCADVYEQLHTNTIFRHFALRHAPNSQACASHMGKHAEKRTTLWRRGRGWYSRARPDMHANASKCLAFVVM